jgi:hypothetical protein
MIKIQRLSPFFFLALLLCTCAKGEEDKPKENEYAPVINYINEHRENILDSIVSKPILAIDLKEPRFKEEHKQFMSDRIDYFIAILNENETEKTAYYEKHREHQWLLVEKDKNFRFDDAIRTLDYNLLDRIQKKFNDPHIPVSYFKEYQMNYRYMINQKHWKDSTYDD